MHPTYIAVAGFALALAFPAPAQKLAWKIPHRGVMFYSRDLTSKPLNMWVNGRFLPGFGVRNAPLLVQGELDPSQRFIRANPNRSAPNSVKLQTTSSFVPSSPTCQVLGTDWVNGPSTVSMTSEPSRAIDRPSAPSTRTVTSERSAPGCSNKSYSGTPFASRNRRSMPGYRF